MTASWEGAVFLGYYKLFMVYLARRSTRHDAPTTLSWIVGACLIPLTAWTLGGFALRGLRPGLGGSAGPI